MTKTPITLALISVLALAGAGSARANPPLPTGPEYREIAKLTKGLRLAAVGSKGRTPIHRDPVEARLVRGTWAPPKAGDAVEAAEGGTRKWVESIANEKGTFEGDEYAGGTYVSLPYESPEEKVVLFHAVGNDFVYVNGEMRPGDPYGTGWLRLPIVVRKGANELLVRVSRGSLRVALEEPPAEVYVSGDDATMPNAVEVRPGDEDGPTLYAAAGVVVVNCGRTSAGSRSLARDGAVRSARFGLAPLTLRKLPVEVHVGRPVEGPFTPVEFALVDSVSPATEATTRVPLHLVGKDSVIRRTFVSEIDGSAQYFAVNAGGVPTGRYGWFNRSTAPDTESIILSLHGAGVEASGQAAAYRPVVGNTVVAPTNRRPFGFDWEDWGRLDAMEVLALSKGDLSFDKSAVYLTGHSMGGHGTWQLGSTYPDLFAAIAPSAGWPSFSTYIGASSPPPADAVEEILRRSNNPSDTMALVKNLAPLGIYILHGDKDDNVPVEQARDMAKVLAGFHKDWRLFEQPGAGHWWDVSKAPGADCVDWPPMFELFARRRIPSPVRVAEVDFTTMDPGVSARCRFVTIEAQTKALAPSRVKFQRRPATGEIEGTTDNVARLSIGVNRDQWHVTVDGASFASTTSPRLDIDGRLHLVRNGEGHWIAATPPFDRDREKNPARGGSFKSAFRNHFRFVYGTAGMPEENAASYSRARLDSETWYYRGNGGAEVLPDTELLAAKDDGDENVILYGNADTNAAWARVLGHCPVRVTRGKIVVGDKTVSGDELGCLFCYPRDGSTKALVGVVGGTGPAGLRVTERLPIFSSGVAFPDLTIVGADALERGTAAVRCAGFFGNDWSVEHGEFAWHEAPAAPSSPTPPTPPEPKVAPR